MARLNDPPGATETVEVVKRRFLRQNRELAKCNSNQSIKIRGLEGDISRLLSENLAYRERVIELEAQVQLYEHRPPAESVQATRLLLETKIQELGQLVAGMDILKKPRPKEKPQALATKKSPHERNWRNAMLLSQAMGGEDILPTISEDKHYPWRTLSEQEVVDLAENTNGESPELGPPPVARFDNEDPIKFDPNRRTSGHVQDEEESAIDDLPPALAANLETRRRRRSSHTGDEMRRMTTTDASGKDQNTVESATATSKPVPKVGSKRKFNVSDDESERPPANQRADDFRFNRRNSTAPASAPAAKRDPVKIIPGRKALGSKPTNLSPKKTARAAPKDQKTQTTDPDKKRTLRITRSDENPRPVESSIPIPSVEEVAQDPSEDVPDQALLPPKTPAALNDVLSPVSTDASTARPQGRDTPPPSDIGAGSEESGRHSRRGRTAVSYAEPKLNVKMRRPGKELVDAVIIKDVRPVVKIEGLDGQPQLLTVEKPKMNTVLIKRERPSDGSDWKDLPETGPEPPSPLSNKTAAPAIESGSGEQPKEAEPVQSAASATISALMANSLKSRRPRNTLAETEKAVPDPEPAKMDDPAIFDFDNSSSPPTAEPPKPLEKSRAESARARTARRHSSINSTALKDSETSVPTKSARFKDPPAEPKEATASTAKPEATSAARYERAASRRKSMML